MPPKKVGIRKIFSVGGEPARCCGSCVACGDPTAVPRPARELVLSERAEPSSSAPSQVHFNDGAVRFSEATGDSEGGGLKASCFPVQAQCFVYGSAAALARVSFNNGRESSFQKSRLRDVLFRLIAQSVQVRNQRNRAGGGGALPFSRPKRFRRNTTGVDGPNKGKRESSSPSSGVEAGVEVVDDESVRRVEKESTLDKAKRFSRRLSERVTGEKGNGQGELTY